MISLAKSKDSPIFPPGWNILNFSLENFLLFITVVAKQSPNNKVMDVLVVGTIPVRSDSFTFGSNILMSLAFNKMLSIFEATPIIFIPERFAYLSILVSSEVLPE